MTDRWDETWHRLREWTNGQGPSERLAAQVLLNDGYEGLDPSHPLGGKDGGKDAFCHKNGQRWIMAVYSPRGQQEFATIKDKFLSDVAGVAKNAAIGIAFVTNQELRLAERQELRSSAAAVQVDLFHLERITAVLDKPDMAGVRRQFLNIDHPGDVAQRLAASIDSNVVHGSIIVTQNQMGGQVAHSITNVGPQPRHLTVEQRQAMMPLLEKLRGRPVAFACRMLDGESCDYATELATLFLQAGCQVPEPIKTSLNDLAGYLAIAAYGNIDIDMPAQLAIVFQVAGIPARIEAVNESSVGTWYRDVVHVIVGRMAP